MSINPIEGIAAGGAVVKNFISGEAVIPGIPQLSLFRSKPPAEVLDAVDSSQLVRIMTWNQGKLLIDITAVSQAGVKFSTTSEWVGANKTISSTFGKLGDVAMLLAGKSGVTSMGTRRM